MLQILWSFRFAQFPSGRLVKGALFRIKSSKPAGSASCPGHNVQGYDEAIRCGPHFPHLVS